MRVVVYLVMVTQVVGTSIIVEKKGMHSDNSTNNMSELSPLVETTTTGVSGFAESRWVRAAWRSRARQPGRVAPELGSEASGNRNSQIYLCLDKCKFVCWTLPRVELEDLAPLHWGGHPHHQVGK